MFRAASLWMCGSSLSSGQSELRQFRERPRGRETAWLYQCDGISSPLSYKSLGCDDCSSIPRFTDGRGETLFEGAWITSSLRSRQPQTNTGSMLVSVTCRVPVDQALPFGWSTMPVWCLAAACYALPSWNRIGVRIRRKPAHLPGQIAGAARTRQCSGQPTAAHHSAFQVTLVVYARPLCPEAAIKSDTCQSDKDIVRVERATAMGRGSNGTNQRGFERDG